MYRVVQKPGGGRNDYIVIDEDGRQTTVWMTHHEAMSLCEAMNMKRKNVPAS